MTAWRICACSLVLVEEVNRRWPARDKTSDGTIGDAAHAARTSDHNPWVRVDDDGDGFPEIGVVRARDIDRDGIDAAWLAEHLRLLGARRDPRLYPGGYVIYNRRITAPDFSGWHEYTGSNPHTSHVHVSFTTTPGPFGFDSILPWGVAPAAAAEADDDMSFTDDDRALLRQLRADIGHARNQTLAALGVIETERAPSRVTAEQAAQIAPARRVDIAWHGEQQARALGDMQRQLHDIRGQMGELRGVLAEILQVLTTPPPKG